MRAVPFLSLRLVVALSMLLYVVSLGLPALSTEKEAYPGGLALAMGWMVVPSGEIRWLANVFYVGALIAIGLTRKSFHPLVLGPALIAAVLALSCLFIAPVVAVGGSSNPGMSSATLESGALLWMLALALMGGASFLPRALAGGSEEGAFVPLPQTRLTFIEAIKTCFSKYADFSGRASRSEYWWWMVFVIPVQLAMVLAQEFAVLEVHAMTGDGESAGMVFQLLMFALGIPWLAVGARRLHDTERSGWLQLLVLVPVIGAPLLLFLLAQKGKASL